MAALSFTERQSCIRSSLKNRLLICLAHFRMQTARKKFYRLKDLSVAAISSSFGSNDAAVRLQERNILPGAV